MSSIDKLIASRNLNKDGCQRVGQRQGRPSSFSNICSFLYLFMEVGGHVHGTCAFGGQKTTCRPSPFIIWAQGLSVAVFIIPIEPSPGSLIP